MGHNGPSIPWLCNKYPEGKSQPFGASNLHKSGSGIKPLLAAVDGTSWHPFFLGQCLEEAGQPFCFLFVKNIRKSIHRQISK